MWSASLIVFLVTNVLGLFKTPSSYTTFDVNVKCKEPEAKNWCVEIFVEEQDLVEVQNDDVFWGQFCTNKRQAHFTVPDLKLYGDGYFDHNYEFSYKVYHTCGKKASNPDGKKFQCMKSSPYIRLSTDKNETAKFDISLKDGKFHNLQHDDECHLPRSYMFWFMPPSAKMPFDSIWGDHTVSKGFTGYVKTWSRYRDPQILIRPL